MRRPFCCQSDWRCREVKRLPTTSRVSTARRSRPLSNSRDDQPIRLSPTPSPHPFSQAGGKFALRESGTLTSDLPNSVPYCGTIDISASHARTAARSRFAGSGFACGARSAPRRQSVAPRRHLSEHPRYGGRQTRDELEYCTAFVLVLKHFAILSMQRIVLDRSSF